MSIEDFEKQINQAIKGLEDSLDRERFDSVMSEFDLNDAEKMMRDINFKQMCEYPPKLRAFTGTVILTMKTNRSTSQKFKMTEAERKEMKLEEMSQLEKLSKIFEEFERVATDSANKDRQLIHEKIMKNPKKYIHKQERFKFDSNQQINPKE